MNSEFLNKNSSFQSDIRKERGTLLSALLDIQKVKNKGEDPELDKLIIDLQNRLLAELGDEDNVKAKD